MQRETFERLVLQVDEILQEGASEQARDFDARAWLSRWLERPQPALGGIPPRDLVGSDEGFRAVSKLLGASISGAYQ
ncbi:MbcA/ParS/Xre antitoxin family protein [Hydrogenophaga sp.]|uniref:MbcA/ParS/Xre antitoxin family protein n=1 Tax=Hydrogenophaga sp. TaxID=1904254 RepID=UPI00391AFE57